MDSLIAELRAALGPDAVLTGACVGERAAGIWRHDHVVAGAIVRPATTDEVSTVLRLCHAAGQTVVTHGGLTGLVEGALASPHDIVLSTERMTAIESVNATDRTMCVQAGVRLQSAQERAAVEGLMLGLDLGARGSCTIGGNVATNAGGNQVIRYGMARESVLGIEAVLADGTVVTSLNAMLKNNAGYDLKHLFIGSEGTLGVITRIMLRLRPAWRSQETALLACKDFAAVMQLLALLDEKLGGTLSAFEVLWQGYYELVAGESPPLPAGSPFYVLVEALGSQPAADHERFVDALLVAEGQGCVAASLVCKSGVERTALWALRDNVEKALESGPAFIFDVSLRLSDMDAYVRQVLARLDRDAAGHRTWVFGHAGDGNLHLVIAPGEHAIARGDQLASLRLCIERAVYEPLQQVSGSVSGEHGIGLEKKRWLSISRTPAELALMRTLKAALDPQGILNPNRIFDYSHD